MDDCNVKVSLMSKLNRYLGIISELKVNPQTKIKIYARYLPSQFTFELKTYNFAGTWIAENMDARCIREIRKWLEAPISSNIKEWMGIPRSRGGLGIPSFQQRAENLALMKRNALKQSSEDEIKMLWRDSAKSNVRSEELLTVNNYRSASKIQKNQQAEKIMNHFLSLKKQSRIISSVMDSISSRQISNWSDSVQFLPGYIFNFVIKAVQQQLPTFSNLHLWGRSTTDKCHFCDKPQTNKHVLSNCGSSSALKRYTDRHNKVLTILCEWISGQLPNDFELFHDLHGTSGKQVSDLFTSIRPDIAIKTRSKVIVLELTICHETNLNSSREYKLDKYKNISHHRNELIRNLPVKVYTCEITTLGFLQLAEGSMKDCNLSPPDNVWLRKLSSAAIMASFDIYLNRNS